MSFSGFYLAMFATLFALILRPVGFKYRSKREGETWRNGWDWALFVGGFVPSLIFGVAVGNVLQGVPFRLGSDLRIFYDGTFFGLLNPYALLCGLLSVAMLAMHGAAWLMLKTSGRVQDRTRTLGTAAAFASFVLFALGGIALYFFVDGYAVTSGGDMFGPSNPLAKTAEVAPGAWFANYAFIGFGARKEGITLLGSFLSIFGIISSVGVSMFPFILPSSADPNASLMVFDSSSSHLTLFIMLGVTLIFLPIVLLYTAWAYKILWGKVEASDITNKGGHAY